MEGLTDPAMSEEPLVLLDAYAARSCPVKTQNRYDRTVEQVSTQPDEALQELFAGGRAFRDEVLDQVATAPGVLDLRGLVESGEDTAGATRDAVAQGVAVIIAPHLPLDVDGHRRGHCDLLVRGADRPDGTPGYRPVHVKRHRVLEAHSGAGTTGSFSDLSAPGAPFGLPDLVVKPSREADLLQLAHYWRMLQAAGWACDGDPVAGVIGTDVPTDGHVIAWVDLAGKVIRTFSRTSPSGWKLRSPLERYDHEFGFRLKVAQVARLRDGSEDDPRQMVSPIVIRECDHCTWWETCKPRLDADDLSLRISKSPLDVREISVLRAHGINTLADLAHTDVEALMETYLPQVAHRHGADSRLRLAARRASLMLDGVELERLTADPFDLPEASLEIDFDIETSAGDRVYLWGFLVHDRLGELTGEGGSRDPFYKAFSRFEVLDNQTEGELAVEAITWLDRLCTERPDTLVYHYSDYEVVHLLRLARRTGDPEVLAAAQRVRAHFVDMFTLVKEHFFGANGLGLKVVAHAGAGFEWRDEDPGGLNSQTWFHDAVLGADELTRSEATTRVLEYNEDDVRATHQLRAWLRGLDDVQTQSSV